MNRIFFQGSHWRLFGNSFMTSFFLFFSLGYYKNDNSYSFVSAKDSKPEKKLLGKNQECARHPKVMNSLAVSSRLRAVLLAVEMLLQ